MNKTEKMAKRKELFDRWHIAIRGIYEIAEELESPRIEYRADTLNEIFYKKMNKLYKVKSKTVDDVIADMDDDSGEDEREEE